MGRFDDKVALVTGAGRGIGAAVARRLGSEGAAVSVLDLDESPARDVVGEIEAAGGRAQAIAGNVADRAAVVGAVDRTVASFGRLDMLVTCAGILRFNPIENITESEWDEVLDAHLKGTFLCAQAAAPHMVAQKSGKIVVFSSGAAKGFPQRAHYSAAKGGIQALAGTLMWELGEHNINVNVIEPGLIDTRMPAQHAAWLDQDYGAFKTRIEGQTPLHRTGTPEDVAGAVAFLCSDDASFVTGQVLAVSGGL